jgi:hypothetical protein
MILQESVLGNSLSTLNGNRVGRELNKMIYLNGKATGNCK